VFLLLTVVVVEDLTRCVPYAGSIVCAYSICICK
jgi:hypothetical protein